MRSWLFSKNREADGRTIKDEIDAFMNAFIQTPNEDKQKELILGLINKNSYGFDLFLAQLQAISELPLVCDFIYYL